ncbi:urocanate hydratase [Bradyrhizobium sp. U87765 SZCCT0131]|nr:MULTISPECIES: urocanate hydratase [unclassified Bradyrhizobium]MBR1221634.1 urocanate hydratase [Bradyrhizobium sp. U87765 SZCCT0131]MBR1264443.1 urocanate hydratase [Bradyrhizobium sp. U87765 SZCCT0134]MBR1304650.1 urocanate hydratase [Bradyrhizobium sp. U87765 SZCCT0110]MBR1322493.1 urocanate hydratase [Bradyrhizobium sp. U87765 SZCCT0109]MBR1346579.1 urocanate hydratase [Bradyrhizobium sp. U87765 SZCCT0048]
MARSFNVTSGGQIRCRGWRQEGLLRLLENVLAVGEDPDNLIVYAALGRAARDWPSHDRIVEALKTIDTGETLLVQSGKPIGVLRTHARAPVVIMANCNMVGQWAKAEKFYDLANKNLICWGGLTAGDWQYIGSQGVIQGTYEIFMRIAARHFGGSLAGRFVLTAGLGGMGGAQPLAGTMAEAAILCIEVDETRIDKRMAIGFLDAKAASLDEALAMIRTAQAEKRPLSVGLCANAADIYPEIARRGIVPDVVTDQTAAHDLVYGYVPAGRPLAEVRALRTENPQLLMDESMRSIVRHVSAMLEFQARGAVVFDNGNLIRTHAKNGGVANAFDIPIFTEAFLRPLFARAIGPFRWIALSNDPDDIRKIDDLLLEKFPDNQIVSNWVHLARKHVPFEGLPARIAWLGHGERTELGLAVNRMVREHRLSGPIAFTRDHLDAGAMAHPNIMTENMRDGSDAIADWPLLNAMVNCASQADLVAIHSGGGGYSGYMTSAGVTLIADGTAAADERLALTLTNDTSTGVMRYADAGYEDSYDEIRKTGINHFRL